MKKKICTAVAILCLILLIGLAGSVEMEVIGFREMISKSIPLCIAIFLSIKIGGLF